MDEVAGRIAAGPDEALVALEDALFWRAIELSDAYLERLPAVSVSRCPFTSELVVIRVDTAGFDGPWWDHGGRLRRTIAAPETFLGLTGAVAIAGPIERLPFPVEPGPGVPFVLPEVLALEGVGAVISQVPIGPHTGYAIAYFASTPQHPGLMAGTDWGAFDDPDFAMDFDLGPWLERGKLRWIAPGEVSLVLRSGERDCPYVGLEGTRFPQRIEDGATG